MIFRQTQLHFLKEFRHSQDEWKTWLQQIRRSKNETVISTFFVEADDYGLAFVQALTAAAKRRVRCVVLIDESGTRLAQFKQEKAAVAKLDQAWSDFVAAGGELYWSRPANPVGRMLLTGNHVKLAIFDRARAIVTGRNIGEWSFARWNDYGALVTGPILKSLMETFCDLLICNGAQTAAEKLSQAVWPDASSARNLKSSGSIPVKYYDFDPVWMGGNFRVFSRRQKNGLSVMLREKIEAARERIWISSFLFKPEAYLRQALLRAAKRGVSVIIAASGANALPDAPLAYWAAACGYEEMLRAGVKIHETTVPEHSKIMAVDGQWAAFGSYNFESQAHDRLREIMIASEHPEFVQRMERQLKAMFSAQASQQVSQRLAPTQYAGYAVMRQIRWFF